MAKKPEEKHGASSAGGEDPHPESNLPNDDLSTDGSEQSELPLGNTLDEGDSEAGILQSGVEETAEETDSPINNQADGKAQHDDPYHDEYHHDYYD